ncbi:VanZ family protein [Mucilaginibacter sp.]|uniref:VanZ family protein n=1 Tax=Mucilaginibacter sp. TaxID=1882438 RepID=UPI003D14F973
MCSIKLGKITQSPLFFPGFDKLVHCGFFFVMVVFGATGYIRQQLPQALSYKAVLIIILISVLYGGIIEILQAYLFTWRSGEWDDLFADIVGALMGAFSVMITVKAVSYDKK